MKNLKQFLGAGGVMAYLHAAGGEIRQTASDSLRSLADRRQHKVCATDVGV